jgi:predicted Zn-dependent protease
MAWCVVVTVWASPVLAFVRNSPNWFYMSNPMGENWVICPNRMPGEAVQRIKDGAAAWNYERFQFTFDPEACLSNGAFAIHNGVNQIDFGFLSQGVLANTVSFFFTDAPDQTVECDMRFSSLVNWYTGTDTPPPDQFDWWSVATHEMGHCLGLDHEDSIDPPPVMRTTLQVGTVVRQLTEDDVAGRNSIYSAPRVTPASPAPPAASSGDDGGGGGCSLSAGHPADTASLLAVLGNLCLPMLVLAVMRVWTRWRRR